MDDYVQLIKEMSIRQLLTNRCLGPNVYWDGSCWRLAGNMAAEGVMITESHALEILDGLKGNK